MLLTISQLFYIIELARKSVKQAYSPYSKFKVGAALVTENDKFSSGFNIECSSYSLTDYCYFYFEIKIQRTLSLQHPPRTTDLLF